MTIISENLSETIYQSGPFSNAEAKAKVRELRSQGIHAYTSWAKDPMEHDWRTMDLYVLERHPYVNCEGEI